MEYIRYIIAVIFGIIGFWILILNWIVFWNRHIKKKASPSWIPLLSGCLLCIAFAIFPANSYSWLCWIAFVIDWGSLPGIVFSIWYGVTRGHLRGGK